MDNWNNYIAMMTRRDSRKLCCAPNFESLGRIAWLHTENPSDGVFMTNRIDIDKNRNYLERELCSSSLPEYYSNVRQSSVQETIPMSNALKEENSFVESNDKIFYLEVAPWSQE